MSLLTGILTISDGCFQGEREDVSGRLLAESIIAAGHTVYSHALLPDEEDAIAVHLLDLCRSGCNLIVTTGGTGFSPRDVTPEATRRVIQREAPGLAELMRWKGYEKLERAVLSRGVCGILGRTLIINLPGSPGGVKDGLELLLPLLPHACALIRDEPVDHSPGKREERRAQGEEGRGKREERTEVRGQRTEDAPPQVVDVIETNIDDLNPELYELVMERLFAAGAVDVYLTPILMKKQRPATLLTVMAAPEKREEMASVIFNETGTLGLRYATMNRITLERRWETVETQYGAIRIKIGSRNGVDITESPEYEDVKAAAKLHGAPAKAVYAAAVSARLQAHAKTQKHK